MAGGSGSFGGAGCAVALGRDALTATAEPFSAGGVTATAVAAFAGSSGLTAVALIFPAVLSFLLCLLALVMTDFSLALVEDDPSAAFATADSDFGCGCAFAGALAAGASELVGTAGMIDAILSFSTKTNPKSVLTLNMFSS